jgi:glycosyltransferase involved in cell wall biosynthesis
VVLTLHDLFTTCARFFRMPDARHFCSREVTFADCATCLRPDLGGMPHAEAEALVANRFANFQAELAAADVVLTVSGRQRDLLLSIPGFERRDLQPLPIGIPDPGPAPDPPTPLFERLRLVNWAGLDPRKGLHVLLEAVAATDKPRSFEVHLWGREGDPGYMDELAALAKDLVIFFHGPFEDAQRQQFAARYDLAVFPFLAFETYGLVVDEALRAGMPVLVADHGAPPERLGGRGLAVPREPAALAAALQELRDDPERLAAMRAAAHGARDLVEHHEALLEVYGRARG